MTQEELNQKLFYAAQKNDLAGIKSLLDKGAEISGSDPVRWTALHYAARHGSGEAIELLIASGADINSKSSSGFTPFLHAVDNGHVECIKSLVKRGANMDGRIGGQNALHLAIVRNYLSCAEYLIESGFDPMAKDDQDRDAVTLANAYGQENIRKLVESCYQQRTLNETILNSEDQQKLEF